MATREVANPSDAEWKSRPVCERDEPTAKLRRHAQVFERGAGNGLRKEHATGLEADASRVQRGGNGMIRTERAGRIDASSATALRETEEKLERAHLVAAVDRRREIVALDVRGIRFTPDGVCDVPQALNGRWPNTELRNGNAVGEPRPDVEDFVWQKTTVLSKLRVFEGARGFGRPERPAGRFEVLLWAGRLDTVPRRSVACRVVCEGDAP